MSCGSGGAAAHRARRGPGGRLHRADGTIGELAEAALDGVAAEAELVDLLPARILGGADGFARRVVDLASGAPEQGLLALRLRQHRTGDEADGEAADDRRHWCGLDSGGGALARAAGGIAGALEGRAGALARRLIGRAGPL